MFKENSGALIEMAEDAEPLTTMSGHSPVSTVHWNTY